MERQLFFRNALLCTVYFVEFQEYTSLAFRYMERKVTSMHMLGRSKSTKKRYFSLCAAIDDTTVYSADENLA